MAQERSGDETILFPHQLRTVAHGAWVQLGGRVVEGSEERVLVCDALDCCAVQLDEPVSFDAGGWLLVRGLVQRDASEVRLTRARVLRWHDGRLLQDGCFARTRRKAHTLRARARAKAAARQFFEERGYLEVSTPVRVAAPGTDVYLEPQGCGDQWLITSPEFHLKRLVAGGVPRVFEFAKCTRRDEVGPWHQPEFTMLEWYTSFQSFSSLLQDTESLVVHLARSLGASSEIRVDNRRVSLDGGFERLTVSEAFLRFAGVGDVASLAENDENRYFQLMVDEVDPALARLPRPVMLTHYPLSQAALAAPSAEHPGYAERFELFIGGVELCNGYGELTCASTQRDRFLQDVRRRAEKGLPSLPIDEGLLAALDEGLPPCAGNAVGFDRLVAVLLQEPLENVIAFPASIPR